MARQPTHWSDGFVRIWSRHRAWGGAGVAVLQHWATAAPSETQTDSLVAAKARPRSASSTAIHLTIPAAKRSYE